jgi:hypothetical protein
MGGEEPKKSSLVHRGQLNPYPLELPLAAYRSSDCPKTPYRNSLIPRTDPRISTNGERGTFFLSLVLQHQVIQQLPQVAFLPRRAATRRTQLPDGRLTRSTR